MTWRPSAPHTLLHGIVSVLGGSLVKYVCLAPSGAGECVLGGPNGRMEGSKSRTATNANGTFLVQKLRMSSAFLSHN